MSISSDQSGPPSRRSSSTSSSSSSDKSVGWFHSLKKAFQHSTSHNSVPHTSDPEFEVSKENFTKLNDTVFRLRDKLNNYIQHAYGLFSNSNGAALDFASLLEDTGTSHPYSSMITDFKINHTKLVGDQETQLAHRLSECCILKLDAEIEIYKELNKRIVIRNDMLGELDYYVNKVDGLKKERDEKLAKGKDDKASEIEKFERNIQKMEEKKNAFTAFNAGVVVDMTGCYRNRVLLLGPVMASFVTIEKELIHFYSEAMDNIKVVEQKEADEGLSRFRSKSDEASQEQFKLQSTQNPIQTPTMITAAASAQRSSVGPSASSPPKQSQTLPAKTGSTDPSVSYPNPLSGMSGTPVAGGAPAQDLGEVAGDKQFVPQDREKRGSASGIEGGVSGGGEVNPFESSLETEKRNQAVFAAASQRGVVSQSENEPVTQ